MPVASTGPMLTGLDAFPNTRFSSNWSGVAMNAGGFFTGSKGQPVANLTTLYEFYVATATVPAFPLCASDSFCNTALWAGIGGVDTGFFGVTIDHSQIEVLQSGFYMDGQFGLRLFYELAPTEQPQPFFPPGPMSPGDPILLWGWAGDANCGLSTSATRGCFRFENLQPSRSWVALQSSPNTFRNSRSPFNSVSWVPSTFEFVAEVSGSNEEYTPVTMQGDAFDSGMNVHWDSGNAFGTDPYVVFEQLTGAGNMFNLVNWANNQPSPAVDPLSFTFGRTN